MKTIKFYPTINKTFVGTSLHGEIIISYADLCKIFGEPNSYGDGYKVSTEWELVDDKGRVATIYDYKQTNLYDAENMSVDEFLELPEYSWHIGAHNTQTANDLFDFIKSQQSALS